MNLSNYFNEVQKNTCSFMNGDGQKIPAVLRAGIDYFKLLNVALTTTHACSTV